MQLLYLTYGTQSGVATRLSQELHRNDLECNYINVAHKFNYRYEQIKIPRLSLANIFNCCIARSKFGKNWKDGYLRTDFAYKLLSREAQRIIDVYTDCHVVLQSGLLFYPKNTQGKTYTLGILDNTYLIGKFGRNRMVTSLALSDSFIEQETAAYHRADCIFAMSDHVRSSLVEDYGVPAHRICVTGVGPNVEPGKDFVPDDSKYESKKIVMIAMEFYRKGGMEVLAAFARLKKKIRKLNLVIIGQKIDIQLDGVSFIGLQDKSRVTKELSEANLFVMPSHVEPFGVAFIEAMAFHTPCIGSTVEAMSEIVTEGITGYLVPPGDIDKLTARMEAVLIDPSLARTLGEAGSKRYEELFTWSRVGKIVNDQILSIQSNKNGNQA